VRSGAGQELDVSRPLCRVIPGDHDMRGGKPPRKRPVRRFCSNATNDSMAALALAAPTLPIDPTSRPRGLQRMQPVVVGPGQAGAQVALGVVTRQSVRPGEERTLPSVSAAGAASLGVG
jgi:hypothetical protein